MDFLAVLRPRLRRFVSRFESIQADTAELALASSGMTRPFACAIFLAYSNWAGLTGLGSSFPGVFDVGFLGGVFAEELAADRDRRFVAGGGLAALLADEAVGKPLHGRRWRIG